MRLCDFCNRSMPVDTPSRQRMHWGCLGRAARHAKTVEERRRFRDRIRDRLRRASKGPKDHRAHMGKEIRKLDVPVRHAQRCEWCPDIHATYAEVALCRQRYERSTQSVREAWR